MKVYTLVSVTEGSVMVHSVGDYDSMEVHYLAVSKHCFEAGMGRIASTLWIVEVTKTRIFEEFVSMAPIKRRTFDNLSMQEGIEIFKPGRLSNIV